MSVTPDQVVDAGCCSGCGGCTALAADAEMVTVAPGYLRPKFAGPLDDRQLETFADVCPGVSLHLDADDGAVSHPVWGPYFSVQTGWATDTDLRFAASSGGALSATLVHLLDSGQVDGILHVAASDSPAYGNRNVISRDRGDIMAAAGSRYAPSAPLDGISEHLDGDARLAFVGKPCDVAALRGLATSDPRVDDRFPVMLSFFCAGVPSLAGAEEVVDRLAVQPADLASFRYRGHGWPGRATATRRDGTTASMSYHESWGEVLSRHLQTRCKICPDGVGSFADLVFADAWESDDDGFPVFEEHEGKSAVIARTSLGQELLDSTIAAGRLAVGALDIGELDAIQPGQSNKATFGSTRLLALRGFRHVPRFTGFQTVQRTRRGSLRRHLREFVGTLDRRRRGKMDD